MYMVHTLSSSRTTIIKHSPHSRPAASIYCPRSSKITRPSFKRRPQVVHTSYSSRPHVVQITWQSCQRRPQFVHTSSSSRPQVVPHSSNIAQFVVHGCPNLSTTTRPQVHMSYTRGPKVVQQFTTRGPTVVHKSSKSCPNAVQPLSKSIQTVFY